MVAVGGFHGLADLTHGQGLGGTLKLRHHLAGIGQVTVGRIELVVLVPAVLTALVHHLVKLHQGVCGGPNLGQELVGLRLDGGLLLVGDGAAVLVLREGQQDVLGLIVARLLHHGIQIGVLGGQLPRLLHLGLEAPGQIGHLVQLAESRLADALLVQVLLKGHPVIAVHPLGQRLQLSVRLGLLLLGHGQSRRRRVVGHRGVEHAGVPRVLLQILRRGDAVELLLPSVVVRQVTALLGRGHALEQPEQVLVGGNLCAIHRKEHRVPGHTGGLIGHVGRVHLRRAGRAGCQSGHEQRPGHAGAQKLFHVHACLSSLFGFQKPVPVYTISPADTTGSFARRPTVPLWGRFRRSPPPACGQISGRPPPF